MRRAFSDTLVKIAAEDDHLLFVTGDLGFQVFDEYRSRFSARYVNAGVAEAQMINFAAGMAADGWHAIAYSIASFATARAFEQIRYCVSYPNLPVTIVGAGRGFTYGNSGVSHHAVDDVGLMTLLPNMTVVTPGDPTEIEQLLPQVLRLPGPAYFTVGRFGEPRYDAREPAVLGRARLLQEGERVAIIGTGEVAGEISKAVALLKEEGVEPAAYQMHTIRPLDTAALEHIAGESKIFVIVEEHMPRGGLWSAVTQWAATRDTPVRLRRLGPPEAFALGNVKRDDLRVRFNYDATAIAREVRALWKHAC